MNRRAFLKMLGIGTVAPAVAAVAEVLPAVEPVTATEVAIRETWASVPSGLMMVAPRVYSGFEEVLRDTLARHGKKLAEDYEKNNALARRFSKT